MYKFIQFIFMAVVCLTTTGCSQPSSPEVVVYTSVDQVFAEPILKAFEQQTGIQVKAAYDVEASKTVGLEKRLLAEKDQPQADVFWNSEHLRTLRLQAAGALAPHQSPATQAIPAGFRDPAGYWTGLGARVRVLIVNNALVPVEQRPTRLRDLTEPRWQGKTAIAKPYFGTTSTHFAALYARWGEATYTQFLQGLKANHVALLSGNSTVRDAVERGEYAFGLTDTDDVGVALQRGTNVTMIFPDQADEGAFAIPYTVALIAGAPHPDAGKRLIDYLLSPAVARQLLEADAIATLLRPDVTASLTTSATTPRVWQNTSPELLKALQPSAETARRILGE
jgi:iron(III) transport system substrate-binding protein